MLRHRIGVAERHMHKTGQQGVERLAVDLASAGGEAPHRLAVIAADGADHLHAPCGFACQLDGALHRLRARVAEEAVLHVSGQNLGELLSEPCLGCVEHDFARHGHLIQLALDCLHHLRVAMPQREHAVPAKTIQKLSPLRVVNIAPFRIPLHTQPRKA